MFIPHFVITKTANMFAVKYSTAGYKISTASQIVQPAVSLYAITRSTAGLLYYCRREFLKSLLDPYQYNDVKCVECMSKQILQLFPLSLSLLNNFIPA